METGAYVETCLRWRAGGGGPPVAVPNMHTSDTIAQLRCCHGEREGNARYEAG